MEGLASDDSVRLIEEHLAVCDDCRKELEELKKGKDEEESRKTHLDEAAPS